MPYTKKTTTAPKKDAINKETDTKVTNESKTTNTPVVEERIFNPEDTIPCRSIVSGGLYIEGSRSHILYSWADCGDVEDVEYRDLIYLVRTRANANIYSPRIIIEDEDFINQNKSVKDFYDSMYDTSDLNQILLLPISQMKAEIANLPIGAKESIKGIAATMIDSHVLDSIQRIKALDEIFGTNMLLTLVQE
jgi:hypothetical protein|nr:MAG TPA: hypothetical protein [Caudoviricetes sp.]